MTIEQAIEQLDWYFEADDGLGADEITKESYKSLKMYVEKSSIMRTLEEMNKSNFNICPACGNVASWNSYFGSCICPNCGSEGEGRLDLKEEKT